MKLSQRLETMLHARLTDEDSIIREAMELAKRYEDAPVAFVLHAEGETFIPMEHECSGQRVRVVLDKEG